MDLLELFQLEDLSEFVVRSAFEVFEYNEDGEKIKSHGAFLDKKSVKGYIESQPPEKNLSSEQIFILCQKYDLLHLNEGSSVFLVNAAIPLVFEHELADELVKKIFDGLTEYQREIVAKRIIELHT